MTTIGIETIYINPLTQSTDFNEWEKQLDEVSKPMIAFMNKYPGAISFQYEVSGWPMKTGTYVINVDITKLGSIYKATNWEYVGETIPSGVFVGKTGKMMGRKRGQRTLLKSEMDTMGFKEVGKFPKHKFRKIIK